MATSQKKKPYRRRKPNENKNKSTQTQPTNSQGQQPQGDTQDQDRAQDSQRLVAINSLESWRTPSMETVIEAGRSNRRGTDNKPPNPQRQTSGLRDGAGVTTQSRKASKANLSINKAGGGGSSQNGAPASQAVVETSTQAAAGNDTLVLVPLKENSAPVSRTGFETSTPVYKSENHSSVNTKSSTMGNGKDFWLELRKQVTALQQGGGTAQGG